MASNTKIIDSSFFFEGVPDDISSAEDFEKNVIAMTKYQAYLDELEKEENTNAE